MLQTDQRYPSVSSQTKGLITNADGSIDIYFGPKSPAGEAANWVQTIPGKSWFVLLRLYGPLEPNISPKTSLRHRQPARTSASPAGARANRRLDRARSEPSLAPIPAEVLTP